VTFLRALILALALFVAGCVSYEPRPSSGGWNERFVEWNIGPDGERVPPLQDPGFILQAGP
jgi:hypothetical protein